VMFVNRLELSGRRLSQREQGGVTGNRRPRIPGNVRQTDRLPTAG
jgi:hypothetical protein